MVARFESCFLAVSYRYVSGYVMMMMFRPYGRVGELCMQLFACSTIATNSNQNVQGLGSVERFSLFYKQNAQP